MESLVRSIANFSLKRYSVVMRHQVHVIKQGEACNEGSRKSTSSKTGRAACVEEREDANKGAEDENELNIHYHFPELFIGLSTASEPQQDQVCYPPLCMDDEYLQVHTQLHAVAPIQHTILTDESIYITQKKNRRIPKSPKDESGHSDVATADLRKANAVSKQKTKEDFIRLMKNIAKRNAQSAYDCFLFDFSNLNATDSHLTDKLYNRIRNNSVYFTYLNSPKAHSYAITDTITINWCSIQRGYHIISSSESDKLTSVMRFFADKQRPIADLYEIEGFILIGKEYSRLHTLLQHNTTSAKICKFTKCRFLLDGFEEFDWEFTSNSNFIFDRCRMNLFVKHLWKLFKPKERLLVFYRERFVEDIAD